MALTSTQWETWRRHIDHIVETRGEWIGLCNGDGEPIMMLPHPLELSAEEYILESGDLELAIDVASPSTGLPLPIVDRLVADGIGRLDAQGRFVAAIEEDFMVVVQRPGGIDGRMAFMVTHVVAEGDWKQPQKITIHGHDLKKNLELWPAPSALDSWKNPFTVWAEDAAGKYATPRTYAPIEMATVADGYTLEGDALEVVRRIIVDSLRTVDGLMGWSSDPMMVVRAAVPGEVTRRLVVRVADESVWETIANDARIAGVQIDVALWWPGDDEPALAYGRYGAPRSLVTVKPLKQ